jgi:cytochrome c-type biogenesis protein CcmE
VSPVNQRRAFLLGAILVSGAALGAISYGNIGENLVYYWDPTQLVEAGDKAEGATVRLGGVVKAGTVQWNADNNSLRFQVTDAKNTVSVEATGAPPQMFREGIGVVVEGTVNAAGVFQSDRLMVKHSNEYKAPVEGASVADLYETVEKM